MRNISNDAKKTAVALLMKYALRKHAYIILTPLNPTFICKTGVYRDIHYFSYFCSNID